MTPSLDFLIVGAQKSGTTTLHEVLSRHPQILMPKGKEWPFFASPEAEKLGWEAYWQAAFQEPKGERLSGKASPQYLPDTAAAKAIHRAFPRARIIVALRDPVERTYSQYRMARRRNRIEAEFSEAVKDWLDPANLATARATVHVPGANDSPLCVAWSEYDRMLEAYAARFPAEQIHVLFTEDLARSPGATFRALFDFLGVDPVWTHESIGKRFHAGGSSRKLNQALLREVPLIGWLARSAYRKMPRAWRYKYEMWNIKSEHDSVRARYPTASARLAAHFRPDVNALASRIGRRPPWGI